MLRIIEAIFRALLRGFLGVFGISEGQPIRYYLDLLLAIVNCFVLLAIAAVIIGGDDLRRPFWVAVAVALLCVLLAGNKTVVLGAPLLFIAFRACLAFFATFELRALALIVVPAAIVLLLLLLSTRNKQSIRTE